MRVRAFVLRTAAFTALISLMGGGCWVEVLRSRGEAVVDWSIDGATDDDACARRGADHVDVRVIDGSGHVAARLTPTCDSFTTSVSLEGGFYHVDATLSDGRGLPVSSTVSAGPFEVRSYHLGRAHLDFGAESFLIAPLSARW
jgi:hypothetical protein